MCPYLAPSVHPPLPHSTPLHKGLSGQFSLNGSADRHRTKNWVVWVYIFAFIRIKNDLFILRAEKASQLCL